MSRSGVVLECDGDRVYIAQPNGVEADFRADELTTTPPEEISLGRKGRRAIVEP